MDKRVTIQDIANELKMSKGTVYRALHDRDDICAETKRKILDLINKYNYKPNKVAKSLSLKNKRFKIGVIIYRQPHFYWDSVKRGMDIAAEELSDFGLEIIYKWIDVSNYASIIGKMDELLEDSLQAVAIVPLYDTRITERINQFVERGIPVVTINDDIEESRRAFYVGPMQKQGGRMAGDLMGKLLMGKGSIIVIKPDIESFAHKSRLQGFTEVIGERFPNINIEKDYIFDLNMTDSLKDGIFRDIITHMRGVRGIYHIDGTTLYNIGDILKDITSDRFILIGHEMRKELELLLAEDVISACISHDTYAQGYYAIKILFAYLFEGKAPTSEKIYTRTDIIMRESIVTKGDVMSPYYT